MLNGFGTSAYLNIIARQHHHAGVRRISDTFLSRLEQENKNHGAIGGFNAFVATLLLLQCGDHTIDWHNDKLIIIQIFRGRIDCGHWALLVVDWTVWKPGIVVLFDSLPDLYPDMFCRLQDRLSNSPLTGEDCKWIQADMPKQGLCSNDCGVWMCCMASLYIKSLVDRDLLSNSKTAEQTEIVEVSVRSSEDDTTQLGGDGREHILKCLGADRCSLDDPFFDRFTMTWT
jgi:hypothetical protein